MSIYDIPGIVAIVYPLAATPTNIQSGFRVSGIYPLNRDVFDESEFTPSFVTDRPPAPPPTGSQQTLASPPTGFISLEDIRPFPMAGPRKLVQQRKKRKSLILTDTPVKAEIENEKKSC